MVLGSQHRPPSLPPITLSKNRESLLKHDVEGEFFAGRARRGTAKPPRLVLPLRVRDSKLSRSSGAISTMYLFFEGAFLPPASLGQFAINSQITVVCTSLSSASNSAT